MSLNDEWSNRIENWINVLPLYFYRELNKIEMFGFVSNQQRTINEAAGERFSSMPVGTRWGAKWEYGWFKAMVQLPEEAKDRRIVTRVNVGGESAIYVDGKNAGATDSEHREVTLTMKGVPGNCYEIMVESYAGHGPRIIHVRPVPPATVTVPEPGDMQVEVGYSSFGIWEEDIYQLWLDVNVLYQLRKSLDKNSLRVAEIDRALKEFTLIVDLEMPYDKMLDSVRKGRNRLKPLLDCINGSTAPELFAFGHSHLDLAWLWHLDETEKKFTRTLGTQMALMEEYPEYQYLQSQPYLYSVMKAKYPELYERIQEKVQKGQIIPDGAMWVEADTNITGGESLIRQFIHGKKFFREEFGVENEFLWLPDVFGYSGVLPQIMKGCGIKYFATAKIFWAYGGAEPFPYNTFNWQGIDGSKVLVHLCNEYSSLTDAESVIQKWDDRVQKDGIYSRLFPFGYGDGGGGATRDHLEYIRRMENLEGVPKVKISTPVQFFRDLEEHSLPDITCVGELYFAAHRGTYTTQAKTKRGNRKCEIGLRETEFWTAISGLLKKHTYPMELLDGVWKSVLLNQFHDILPGSSIRRVYEEAEASYEKVLEFTRNETDNALKLLVNDEKAITVFNSLSWDRKSLIELPQGMKGLENEAGEKVPVQFCGDIVYAEVTVPSSGWAGFKPCICHEADNRMLTGQGWMENEILRLEFNEKGEITSIFDKEAGKQLAKGLCNSFKMYKDVTNRFDAWDIDSMYDLLPVSLDEPAEMSILCSGPLMAKKMIRRKLNQSVMCQEVILRSGSRRVEFKTQVDWQESHKLLKVSFPVDIYTTEAVNEIQFGHIKRPNHKTTRADANKFEVCNHKWTALMEEKRGFAVLNDCKYGVSTLDNNIQLTLLKSALAPDMVADKGLQEFTYAFYPWNGSFAESDIIREAYELNIPTKWVSGFAQGISLFALDIKDIIIDTVKLAEDGSGDLILRMYESKGTSTSCTFKTVLPVRSVYQTNMLEQVEDQVQIEHGVILLKFRPFEIKTLRLVIAEGEYCQAQKR